MIGHSFRLICFFIISLHAVLPLAGCGAVIVGGAAAGTVAYIQGDLNSVLEASVDRSARAVDAAIKKTGVRQISKSIDNLGAHYSLMTSQDEKVEITLKKAGKTATEVVIRVGFFGDETLSHQILEEIESALK